jgi:hypothetical protein
MKRLRLSGWNVSSTIILAFWTSHERLRMPGELAGRSHAGLR